MLMISSSAPAESRPRPKTPTRRGNGIIIYTITIVMPTNRRRDPSIIIRHNRSWDRTTIRIVAAAPHHCYREVLCPPPTTMRRTAPKSPDGPRRARHCTSVWRGWTERRWTCWGACCWDTWTRWARPYPRTSRRPAAPPPTPTRTMPSMPSRTARLRRRCSWAATRRRRCRHRRCRSANSGSNGSRLPMTTIIRMTAVRWGRRKSADGRDWHPSSSVRIGFRYS
mmetsp:Transcript_37942/g.91538  ORF Transcript_37942/g.91538 Transcript_37942/m.91538 type:complete len:224 (-) Transcript_37942:1282-1953(-)